MNSTEINSVIDHLADKLAVPVSALNDALMRQATVALMQNCLWLACYVVCIILLVRNFKMLMHKKDENGDTIFDCLLDGNSFAVAISSGLSLALSVIGIVVFIFLSFYSVNTIITVAVNPQWYAIKTILSLIE